MSPDHVRQLLRGSEGKRYRIVFVDGDEIRAEVVSATHVDLDNTIILLRVGALPEERAWHVHLDDIRSIAELVER
jgi:hypothetical protein